MKKNYTKRVCALLLAGTLLLTACDEAGKNGSTQTQQTSGQTSATGTAGATTEPNKKPDYTELE